MQQAVPFKGQGPMLLFPSQQVLLHDNFVPLQPRFELQQFTPLLNP
jgi:hypothetical protein